MTGKAAWMTGTVLGLATLLPANMVMAQPHYGYPGADNPQEQDDPYVDEEVTGEEDRESGPQVQQRADDDFSDVIGGRDEQADTRLRDRNDSRSAGQIEATSIDQDGEEAITECAVAAREEAEHDGGFAEVRQVQEPLATRNGYQVEGDIDVRSSWRSDDARTLHFTCSVQDGRITKIQFPRSRFAP